MENYKIKKRIITELVSHIETNFSQRTTEYNKCYRDLEYIYDAITYDVKNLTTDQTRLIASKFWYNGKRQLKSIDVEFQIYDLLKIELIKHFQKDEDITALITILKDIIENGPELSFIEETIYSRRNIIKFDNSIKVPKDLESMVDHTIVHTPSQLNTEYGIFKLTEEDQHIKDFLSEFVFYNDSKSTTKHMISISTAPLVYVIQFIGTNEFAIENQRESYAIHAGAVMQTVLNYGFNFAFIGCGPDRVPITQQVKDDWKDIMNNRFNLPPHPINNLPSLCLCIGKGDHRSFFNEDYIIPTTQTVVKTQNHEADEMKARSRKLFY